jgi:hypothetical protein
MEFKDLFHPPQDFERIFPPQSVDSPDQRIPRRGLREIMRFGHMPILKPLFKEHPILSKEIEEWERAEQTTNGKSQIARYQEQREELHEKWSKKRKEFIASEPLVKDYIKNLAMVARHRERTAHVTLTNHVRIHRLMMTILGRLLDFSGLWERDLYFVTLALIHELGLAPKDVFNNKTLQCLADGQIVKAVRNVTHSDFKKRLEGHFKTTKQITDIRNAFAHFNMLQGDVSPDLTHWVNQARALMDYDRKLKNAVSQAVVELLKREGVDLVWSMDATQDPHALGNASIRAEMATHLGELKVEVCKGDRGTLITEALHGDAYIQMVGSLFAGQVKKTRNDVTVWDIDNVRLKSRGSAGKNPGSHLSN